MFKEKVTFKGTMTKWPVQNKYLEQHITRRTTRLDDFSYRLGFKPVISYSKPHNY